MRNRSKTENDILKAVDSLFSRKGFHALGINAIAREAEISKVLIYRYFGSHEKLLETWALKNSYWSVQSAEIPETGSMLESAKAILSGLISSLREDPVRREVLRWLLTDDSEVAGKVRIRLESSGLALTRAFMAKSGIAEDRDAEALVAILTAGISYLVLMTDKAGVYNGVALDSDEGWSRIDRMAGNLMGLLLR